MTAIKYDVTDVESGGGGEDPQPGMYHGKIVSVTNRKQKNDGTKISDLEIVVDVGQEYTRLWTYVKLPDDPEYDQVKHGWKLRELTDALGLPAKGSIDPKKINNKEVNVKVAADRDLDGNYRGKVKNLFAPTEGTTSGGSSEATEDEEPWTEEDLQGLSAEELKAEVEAFGLDVKTSGRGWQPKAIAAILEAQEEGDGEAEADGGSSNGLLDGVDQEWIDELKADADHYADWGDDDIKEMIAGLGIEGNVKTSGRGWRAKAVQAIVDLAEQVDGGGTEAEVVEGEAEAEEDTYDDENEWSLDDLKEEIKDRREQGAEIEISGRATRAKLVAALREDDKNAEPF